MDVEKLYQAVILDHFRAPRNQIDLSQSEAQVERLNPACGDRIRLQVSCDSEQIEQVEYNVAGCAICVASASLMSEALTGSTLKAAIELHMQILDMLSPEMNLDPKTLKTHKPEELSALAGVHQFPMRISCARLPWDAFGEWLKRQK